MIDFMREMIMNSSNPQLVGTIVVMAISCSIFLMWLTAITGSMMAINSKKEV